MSDSRLEKFIYAICSMDVTDLPVPLSRIEKLWNCLITGETPDFEPLSRNEKYLMAMLDRYDISNLPAPMSRGEKLLYKIAVGETDLSDVPGYLSRYEELLKYLIENGGISGGDFEYILYTINQSLYTLYTTAKKPVKSAILTGQTLVNLCDLTNIVAINKANVVDKTITIEPTGYIHIGLKSELSSSEIYTLMLKNFVGDTSTIQANLSNNLGSAWTGTVSKTTIVDNCVLRVIQLKQGETEFIIRIRNNGESNITFTPMFLIGEETIEQNYFEGMQSVKMPVLKATGKNLFDKEAFYNDWKGKQETYVYKEVVDGEEVLKINNFNQLWADGKGFKISVKKDNPLTMSMKCKRAGASDTMAVLSIRYGDNARAAFGQCKSDEWIEVNTKFTPSQDYIEICSGYNVNDYFYIKDVQLEEGSTVTEYEPYKTNILTVNEDVELGSVGEVEDELNSLTGQLTQRTETRAYQEGDESNSEVLTDMTNTRYKLPKEVVKTVDLTTIDQDNQPTQLGTFENITHVSLESAGLIPEVEMEVATRISKELASTSPLMDDISMKQEQLNTTVDEQSNNVDATMIATTEIYEETL